MIRRFLQSTFPVREGEGRLTIVLFGYSLCAVGAFVAGRSVRDALFLAHMDRASLPWMYVASAVAVALMGLLYNPLAARVRRDRIAIWTSGLFAVAFMAMWWLERGATRLWVYPALYVYVELMGALVVVQFWTLCNEVWNAREAKRLYGLIGAGGTLSNVVVGLITSRVALSLGASALLPLCAVLLAFAGGAAYAASKVGRERLFARAALGGRQGKTKKAGGLSRILESGHLRSIAILAVVTFFTVTLIDFEFKVIAAESYQKNELAAFFGRFYAVVGVLAVTLQLFGTGRLLTHLGVIATLAILPAALLVANAAVLVWRGLWAASLAKGSDTLFRYSINDASTQILYLPVAPHARASAKAFIDGVVKPTSIALAGLALLAYRSISGDPYHLAWLSTALAVAWLLAVLGARRHYIGSLQETLRNRRLDLASLRFRQDGSTTEVLGNALGSSDPREVLGALELLPQLAGVHLDAKVEPLLDHPLVEVRIAALEYFGKQQALRYANSVFRRFEDPEPRVRASAVEVFCNLGRDKAVRSVRPYLADPDPTVRAAAVTGIIRYGGLEGVLHASEALKGLISDPDAAMRAHAAKILGDIGVRNFYQPVLELMDDADLHVRKQAIAAAAKLRSPEFVLPLLYKTRHAELAAEAVDALAQFGGAITPALAKVLSNRLEDTSVRRGVARVLGRLGTPEAVEVITGHLDDPDEEVRTRLYRSLSKAVRGHKMMPFDKRQVHAALERELLRAVRTLAQAEALELASGLSRDTPRSGPMAAAALLGAALTEKVGQTEQRVFLLLSVLYPEAGMERIYAGIRDATAVDAARRRANAVELLDNLLDRTLRAQVLPLLDEVPRAEKLRLLSEVLRIDRPTAAEALSALCQDETAWVRACAMYFLTEAPFSGDPEAFVAGVTDPNPVVREIALVGCAKVSPERTDTLIRPRLADDAPIVRRRAELLTRTRA